MMVSYVQDSTTLWKIWDPAFQVVRSQWNVVFDEERNSYASCLPGDHTDIFGPLEETEYIGEIDRGYGLLQTQDNETGGDGLNHDHAGNSRTGEGHGSGDHDCTDNDTDRNLADADNRRSLPEGTFVSSRPPDEEDAPPVSRDAVVHNQHLRRENDKACRTAPMTKHSCQPPPHTNRITRGQVKISANAPIIMPKSPASTTSNPFTYVEQIDSPQHEHRKQAMEVE